MINPALYAAFVATSTLLMVIPGPNVAVITANSVAYGTRYGLLTVAGTSAAMVPQLLLTGLGMTALLGTLANWFEWVRWAGVLYLVYLGVQQWRQPPVDLTRTPPQPKSRRNIFFRGFLVSSTNPKTLLFYGAFFPQFVDRADAIFAQIVLLSVTFLAVATAIDSGWAIAAGRLRHLLAMRGRLRNRLTGGLLIGAAAGLALARRPT